MTNNPGGASSSSTTPAANPPSHPSRAGHEGHGGKARKTSDLVDTGSDAFQRPAAPPTVPDGIQEHSASKTPYRRSKSAWSIHLITNLQVDLDVPLDGVEPLSTPMHDLQVAEDESMVHNREKDVAASATEDIISSSEVFHCAIREKIKVTHASVLEHVEAAPLTCLPDTIQVLVKQLQKDRNEEAAYMTTSSMLEEAMQISRHASRAEAANTEQDAIQAGLQQGANAELQYGSVLDFTGQPGGKVVDLIIRSKSPAALRPLGGTAPTCKVYVCKSMDAVRDKASGVNPESEGGSASEEKKAKKENGSRAKDFFNHEGCHCIVQAQLIKMGQLRRGAYKPTSWTKFFYGLGTESNPTTRISLPQLPSLYSDVPDDNLVWVCTLYKPHTCLATPIPPPIPPPSCASCAASNTGSTSTIPSSAGALSLVPAGCGGRRVKASHHVSVLKSRFDASKSPWSVDDVFEEMQRLDSAANRRMAFAVLRELKAPSILSPAFNVSLLHGLAHNLGEQGFGVAFHMVSASTVATMIVDIAKNQYRAWQAKDPVAKSVPFNPDNLTTVISKYTEDEDHSNKYVIGWTLIPKNMMYDNLLNFIPVDAIDGAAMRDDAAGTMFIRATKDANENVHPISISVLLTSECNAALNAHMTAENVLLRQSSSPGLTTNSPLDAPGRVTITDGGPALMGVQNAMHPSTSLFRCMHHMKEELRKRCKLSLQIYEELLQVPFGRVQEADELFAKLPERSPLRKIPREQICQAYLHGSLFGVKTNNFAEVSNHMFAETRKQKELCNSLLATVAILKRRRDDLRSKVQHLKAMQNFRQTAALLRPEDTWPQDSITEPVFKEHTALRAKVQDLLRVHKVDENNDKVWRVTLNREIVHVVDLNCFHTRQFHKLCSCGKGGFSNLWCKETEALFRAINTDWRAWVPYWCRADTWERQVGPDFCVPGGQEIIRGLVSCHATSQFLQATQPEIRPAPKGRPSILKQLANEKRRLKSIIEDVHSATKAQTVLGHYAATGGQGYNPGGKGTSKTCSFCKSSEHRRDKCPSRDLEVASVAPTLAAPRQMIDREAIVNAFFVNVDDERNKQPGQMESVSLEEPEKVEEAAARETAASVISESDATTFAAGPTVEAEQVAFEEPSMSPHAHYSSVEGAEEAATSASQRYPEDGRLPANNNSVAPFDKRVEGLGIQDSVPHNASTLESIKIWVNRYIKDVDLNVVSMKKLKAQLETELGVKQGSHYDREWLRKTVDDVIAAPEKEEEAEAAESAGASEEEDEAAAQEEEDASAQEEEVAEADEAGAQEEEEADEAGAEEAPGAQEEVEGMDEMDEEVADGEEVNMEVTVDENGAPLAETDEANLEVVAQVPASVLPRSTLPPLEADSIQSMTVKAIQSYLRAMGLTPKLLKKDLVAQLRRALREQNVENELGPEVAKWDDHARRKNASEAEVAAFERSLTEAGYEVFDVVGDGACFFRCLALHFEFDEHQHAKYRDFVVGKLPDHKHVIAENLHRRDGQSTEEAMEWFRAQMAVADEWVSEEGILLTALALEVDLVVHDGTRTEPERYASTSKLTYANPSIHVLYDGEHYKYLRPSKADERPKYPTRGHYGHYRDDDAQARFDKDIQRWSRHCVKHDEAVAAWKRRETERESGASNTGGSATHDSQTNFLQGASMSDIKAQDPPAPAVLEKAWRMKPDGRLSSFFVIGPDPHQQCPWSFSLRYELDGSEKGCLLMRGAQELDPALPIQDLVPLDETSPFQPNSTLSSFWTIMHTSPAKDNTFYFVRKRGDACDGVMLLRRMQRKHAREKAVILEIVRCCASGAKGNGALLVFQLCTLLFILEPNTKIRVNLGGCKAESKAFWEKVGFSVDGAADVAEFARASYASTSALLNDVSAESSPKRARKESFVDVLTMSVKDRKAWEMYLTTEHLERMAIDSEIAAATEIDEHLLSSQWSKDAVEAWRKMELERYYSHQGAQKSKEDVAKGIQAALPRP